jgi:hypothetical protein
VTARQAAGRVEHALGELNRREHRTGLPPLDAGDHSWPGVIRELQLRVGQAGLETVRDGRPSMRSLEAVGAWVLVAMMVLDRAELLDVAAGEAA